MRTACTSEIISNIFKKIKISKFTFKYTFAFIFFCQIRDLFKKDNKQRVIVFKVKMER